MNKHPILASLLSVVCTAMLFSSPSIPESWAATSSSPGKITYQGFLTDQAGVPIGNNGPVNRVVIFRIFGSESGSDLKWSSQQTVTVDKGHFSVLLGEGGASSDGANLYASDLSDLFTGSDVSDRFLELEVEGTKITPRMQFLSAPYALLARNAQAIVSPNGSKIITPADGALTVSGTLTATGAIGAPSVTATGNVEAAAFIGGGSQLTGLTAGQIPSLDAGKVTTGQFSTSRIPSLDASKVTTGQFSTFRIPNLDASKITSGTLRNTASGYQGMIEYSYNNNDRFGMTFLPDKISTAIYHSHGNISSKIQFGKMTGASSFSPQMTIKHDGKIGIGTDNPTKAHVEIAATGGAYLSSTAHRVWSTSSPGAWYFPESFTAPASLWASGYIVADLFVAVSDERIKNIIGQSDRIQDLAMLRQIEVTDYVHKDVIANGNRPQKKVIAQQVEKVFPQAVSKIKQCVPNIYMKAEVNAGWVNLDTDLKVGDRVKLLGDGLNVVLPVNALAPGKFQVALDKKLKNVFVYGREVDDFRMVDYDALSMLHLSATQELARRLDQSQSKVAELERKLQRMNTLEKRLARLEKAMIGSEVVRSAKSGDIDVPLPVQVVNR